MADYSYVGSGKIYMRRIGASVGLIEVGNCSGLNFAVTENTIEQQDYTQPGGGTFNEVKRVSAVEAQINQAELSPENLARALYGTASAVASAVIASEAVTVYPAALSPFAKLPASTPTPTVAPAQAAAAARTSTPTLTLGQYLAPATANGYYYKVTTAGTGGVSPPTFPTVIGATVTDGDAVLTCAGKTTLVAGTDYEIRAGGVFAYEGSTIAGESWTVGYTSVAFDVVQALTQSGQEYELVFDGLNEARSGKRTRITGYRYKPGAAQNLGFIGDAYAVLEVTGKLLKDTSKTGAGVSQYYKLRTVGVTN